MYMDIQLIRHATLVVTLGDLKLLVDPMLSPARAMDPVANAANQRRIPLVDLPLEDAAGIRDAGFTQVQPIEQTYEWRRLQLTRTGGQHGTGQMGQQMGPVSGFVIRGASIPSLYIAGDTIWCAEVAAALEAHRPDVIVLNAGSAQFLTGDPITMTASDVVQVCDALPSTQVVAVHMEAINHCLLTRADLREQLRVAGRLDRVRLPQDGETLAFGA